MHYSTRTILAYIRAHPDQTAQQIAEGCGMKSDSSFGGKLRRLATGAYITMTSIPQEKGKAIKTYRVTE